MHNYVGFFYFALYKVTIFTKFLSWICNIASLKLKNLNNKQLRNFQNFERLHSFTSLVGFGLNYYEKTSNLKFQIRSFPTVAPGDFPIS